MVRVQPGNHPAQVGQLQLATSAQFKVAGDKPKWDVHFRGVGNRALRLAGDLRPLIAGPSGNAVSPRPSGQPGQEFAYSLLHRRPGPRAQIAGGFLSRPASDGLIGIEVRAVPRQIHQPQAQVRRPQVLPHRLSVMGRGIVPDDPQRPRVLSPQCFRKATDVPALLLPSSSIHSTCPVSRHTDE